MNAIMKEITGIMETNCDGCQVAAVIQRAHGQYQKLEYCNRLCAVGKKLQKLSKELEFGAEIETAPKLTEEYYLLLKQRGWTDKRICKHFGIGRNTLARRKKHWGIEPSRPKRKIDKLGKTKQDYLALKLQNFSDKEIAKIWGIGKNTLLRWKRANNIKGGLEQPYKLDEQCRTKEEYLALKLQEKTDREIARMWGVGKSTLMAWKKRHNIRGGL